MWHALLAEFGVEAGHTRLPQPPITEEVRSSAAANATRLRQIVEELGIAW